jgi:hypothetical protein
MTRLRMHWCEQLVRRLANPDGASRHESATLPQCACGPLSGDCLNLVGLRTVSSRQAISCENALSEEERCPTTFNW